ncbi:MAG: hypothetical protein J3R72DRAFT_498521 [Linnemannia gamsii]|nr:MAG: hypothetical protein J3R72DRAFT_498521 [Linnemannia gamsii]
MTMTRAKTEQTNAAPRLPAARTRRLTGLNHGNVSLWTSAEETPNHVHHNHHNHNDSPEQTTHHYTYTYAHRNSFKKKRRATTPPPATTTASNNRQTTLTPITATPTPTTARRKKQHQVTILDVDDTEETDGYGYNDNDYDDNDDSESSKTNEPGAEDTKSITAAGAAVKQAPQPCCPCPPGFDSGGGSEAPKERGQKAIGRVSGRLEGVHGSEGKSYQHEKEAEGRHQT